MSILRWPFFRLARRTARAKNNQDMDDALWEADRALRDAKNLRYRADAIGDRLRETGRRNHFGEAVARALRGDT